MPPSPPFVGRARELATLRDAWEHVANGRGPRTVALIAEAGLGKTRLVQALYDVVAADGAATIDGERGYWPTSLGRDGNALRVHPTLDGCAPAAPMTFFWWGIRLGDPLGSGHLASGALAASVERDLVPHLEPFHRAARRASRRSRAATASAGLVADLVVDAVPFASLLKNLVGTTLELKGIHDEGRRDGVARDLQEAAAARELTFVDRVVGDLAAVLERGGPPTVLVVDDAHFSTTDAGVTALVARLHERAADRRWPLLVLLTHWESAWRDPAPGSLAAALRTPGARRVDELRLAPVADLGPWLRSALPGLRDEQAQALLERAGGNPRFLDEIVRFATSMRGRTLFDRRDPTRPLTQAGLADLLARSVLLVELIADRLATSPDAVQHAVVLAALQGTEVLDDLVPSAAAELGLDAATVDAAYDAAAERHAYLARVGADSAAFAQRVYLEVAREHLHAWFDLSDAEAALAAALRDVVSSGRVDDLDDADRARLATLLIGTFEGHDGAFERRLVVAAYAQLVRPALHRFDVAALERLNPGYLAALERLDDADLDPDLEWLTLALDAARRLDLAASQRDVLERFVRLTQATHDEHVSQWGATLLARARVALGDHLDAQGDQHAAIDQYAAANAALAALGDERLDEDALAALRLTTDRIAVAALAAGHLDAAEERFEAALAMADALVAIDADHMHRRAATLRRLGACAFQRGDVARAAERYEQARVAALPGDDATLLERLTYAETCLALCETLAALADPGSALRWARVALDVAGDALRESAAPEIARLHDTAAAYVDELTGTAA